MATNTLYRPLSSGVDTSNDEHLARILQEQENDKLSSTSTRGGRGDRSISRPRAFVHHVSRIGTTAVRESTSSSGGGGGNDDSVIMLDSSDCDSPVTTTPTRPREMTTTTTTTRDRGTSVSRSRFGASGSGSGGGASGYSRRSATTDTSKDEELARRLQAEFDQERRAPMTATNRIHPVATDSNRSMIPRNLGQQRNLHHYMMTGGNVQRPTQSTTTTRTTTTTTQHQQRVREIPVMPQPNWLMDDMMNRVATETTASSRRLGGRHPARQTPLPDDHLAMAFGFLTTPETQQRLQTLNQPRPRTNNNITVTATANQPTRIAIRHHTPFMPFFGGIGFGFGRNIDDSDDYESLLRLDDIHSVSRGLSNTELAQLPTFDYKPATGMATSNDDEGNSNTCSICIDDFKSRDEITALACSHKFHKKCIHKWLKEKRRCPLCQKDAFTGE